MSALEWIAVLLGIANIVLIIRRSVWNYAFALPMVSLYFFIFRDAKLYSDAGLQVFFLAVNLYGLWEWLRNQAEAGEIIVERLSRRGLLLWLAGSVAAILLWGTGMHRYTDASFPYWDASVAMLSIAGQVLMARRYLENWWWWIVVNIISVPLYWVKDLYLTSGLYALSLVLAIAGLVEWRRVQRGNK
jgi:nicotinamide mononucleotide transporter